MNLQAIDLGLVLKQVPGSDFSMGTFQDRLKLQKTVYLLQAFGVYLGYDFSWYLRGPYCPVLTTNGFILQEIYDKVPNREVKFQNPKSQSQFEKFLKFVRDKTVDDLEVAASIHYTKHVFNMSDSEVKKKVENKQKRFTAEQVEGIWRDMAKWGLI